PIRGVAGSMHVGPKGQIIIPYTGFATGGATASLNGVDSVRSSQIELLVSDNAGHDWLGVRHGPVRHSVDGLRGHEAASLAPGAIDLSSGPNRGAVYIAYADFERDLDRYVVRVARTGDLGKTWSTTLVSDSVMRGAPSN